MDKLFIFFVVHNASDYSRKSFWRWVSGAVFSPRVGVSVTMKEMEIGAFRSPASCDECQKTWRDSGLQKIVGWVRWEALRHRSDIEALLRMPFYACLLHITQMCFFCYTCPLGTALRGAQLHGYTNGLSKALSWRIVDLVTMYRLCSQHSISLHV